MIDHIVFDIGRVLIHWDPEKPFLDLIPDRAERAHFLSEICNSAWNLEQDRGRPWPEAEDQLIAIHPEKAELIRSYRRHWSAMVPHAYDETVAILRALLAEGRDVTLLTNFAADTFREAQGIYGFLTEARGVTVSGEIGLVKPDPAIYAHHAKRFALDPARSLFIDDSLANVQGARAAGWQAIHFQDAQQLRRDLALHGISVPANG